MELSIITGCWDCSRQPCRLMSKLHTGAVLDIVQSCCAVTQDLFFLEGPLGWNNWLKGCVSPAGSWHSSITQTRPQLMLRNLAQALCSSSSQKQTPLCLTQTKGSNMMHHCLGGSIGLLDTQHIGSSRVIEKGSSNALHGTSVQW